MELQQQMPDRKLGGFLNFRQPGDYGRYVADNDPGGVASGFSNLEDFLAATPDYKNPVFDNLLKNDGTRVPITEEQLGSGKDTMPFKPFKPGGLLGPMKNDGTRAPITEEQLGSGKDTMPSIPFKQTLTGQPLVQQVQFSLMNRMKKSPEYLAWADTVMQTGGYPTEENPGEMGTIKSLEAQPIFSGIGSLITTPQQPGLGDLLGSGNENSFTPQQPVMPTSPYQEQLTGFGEQLTGFGNQLTGFNDQFGGFNDQFGGFNNQFKGLDKQFDMINTRLNSVDEGIASLSKQSQPQQQSYNSPYPNFNFRTNSYSNSSPFGLSSLFMGMY